MMIMKNTLDPLIGTKIQLVIEEDGTANPPSLPTGTVLKRMGNPEGGYYFLVRLDGPVRSIKAKTGEMWTLVNLLVWPSFQGDSLDRALSGNEVPVGISNVLQEVGSDLPLIDPSKVVYFARGIVKGLN